MPARARSLNLTALLAALALLELVLNRSAARLLLPHAAVSSSVNHGLLLAASFLMHFAGLLGLAVLTGALRRTLVQAELFPRSMRLSLLVVALVFVAITAAGIVYRPLSDRQFLHARTSQAFFALFVILGVLRTVAPGRQKLAVVLFAAPLVLASAALFWRALGGSGEGLSSPAGLALVGELTALAAAASAPVLLAQRPLHAKAIGLAVAGALVVGTALLTLVVLRFDLVQSLALHGIRIEVPPASTTLGKIDAGLLVAAAMGVTLTVVLGLAGSPATRLGAYGLVLLVSAGYQPGNAPHLVLSVTGLLALAIGVVRATDEGVEPGPAPALSPAA